MTDGGPSKPAFRPWGVRYQISDISRAIAFYTTQLGFTLDLHQGTAFAKISCDGLSILLSGPGSSGARPLPDGTRQLPGGWNRVVLRVDDLEACVAALTHAGVRFRNAIESGPGGKQVQIEDPDGNPIELFEPASVKPA